MSKITIHNMRLNCFMCFIIFSCINIADSQIVFEKTYGSNAFEEAKSIRQTSDGGYIMGGTRLIKTNELGFEEWVKEYQSLFATPTYDQGYILIDSNGSTITFTKVALNGDIIWTNNYSQGIWSNEGNHISPAQDGGYIVAGRYQDVVGSGMLLLKLDSLGNKIWQRSFSEATSAGFSYGFSSHQTNDNGYFITGYTNIDFYESTRHTDVFVLKTDSLGIEEWRNYIGGSEDETAAFGMQNNEGNYYVVGSTNSYNNGIEADIYLIKLDSAGDTIWTRTFGGEFEESGNGLWPTNDGGCILAGHSNSFSNGDKDGYVIKLDSNGNTLWTENYGKTDDEFIYSIQQTSDAGYIMAGSTNSTGAGNFDMYAIKTDSLGNSENSTAVNEYTPSIIKCDIYPNPNNGVFSMTSELEVARINIFNVLGEAVYSKQINAKQANINLSQQAKGIYFYEIYSSKNKRIKSGKIIFE